MTKVLLASIAALAILVSVAGTAEARQRGHKTPGDIATKHAHETYIYSSLCRAAIPVPTEVRSDYETRHMHMRHDRRGHDEARARPIMIYAERNYNYSP